MKRKVVLSTKTLPKFFRSVVLICTWELGFRQNQSLVLSVATGVTRSCCCVWYVRSVLGDKPSEDTQIRRLVVPSEVNAKRRTNNACCVIVTSCNDVSPADKWVVGDRGFVYIQMRQMNVKLWLGLRAYIRPIRATRRGGLSPNN